MGEYMQASIFKELNAVTFFSNTKDILFDKLRVAKSQEEKNLIAMEFALYDIEKKVNLLDLMNPIFWQFNNKNYVTYDGIFGLYDIFPPIHQYYKYYMPNGWLVLTKPEEFELSKNFGKAVISMSIIKKRLNLLLTQLNSESEVKIFFLSPIPNSNGLTLHELINSSNDNDYLYLSLGRIYDVSEGDNLRDISKEIEIIQNKRNEITDAYNLKDYFNYI